jgi:large subunit ribosomal protein L1
MARMNIKRKEALSKFDPTKSYSLIEAAEILKQISYTKFDPTIDIGVRLGVDPHKADQMVSGVVARRRSIAKSARVLVLCSPDKEEEAKAAGADFVGLDEYISKIEKGWTDIDVIITMPTVMAKIGRLGKILGPKGLMPSPNTGTVTFEIGKAVQDAKASKVGFVNSGINPALNQNYKNDGNVIIVPPNINIQPTHLLTATIKPKLNIDFNKINQALDFEAERAIEEGKIVSVKINKTVITLKPDGTYSKEILTIKKNQSKKITLS